MTLGRTDYKADGIFGCLFNSVGAVFCLTIEKAYLVNSNWMPKLAAGTYTCKRRFSPHFDYDVFQVMDVPPFQGSPVTYLEIHIANIESDLDGCIGLGESLGTLNGVDAVLQSTHAFHRFMALQNGVNSFQLTVS